MIENIVKKTWLNTVIILIAVISLTFSGCISKVETSDKIMAPQVEGTPLAGQWEIVDILPGKSRGDAEAIEENWTGKKVEMAKDGLLVDNDFWSNISYKIKRVNAEEYFLYRFRQPAKNIDIKDKEIFVINISSEGKFLCEIIKTAEGEAILSIEEQYFRMKKISEKTGEHFKETAKMEIGSRSIYAPDENTTSSSGLLLGIRTPVKAGKGDKEKENIDNIQKYIYRTLWISYQYGELRPIFEADDIFLPRISGFWRLGVKERTFENKSEEVLYTHEIVRDETEENIEGNEWDSFWNNKEGIIRREILYAGNDYVSIALTGEGVSKPNDFTYYDTIGRAELKVNNINSRGKIDEKQDYLRWSINRYQTLTVDYIDSFKGIKISDIAGENANLALQNAIDEVIGTLDSEKVEKIDKTRQDENFALFRKTGHWFFKGRLGLLNNEGSSPNSYQDFYINLIPPLKLVSYDELHASWTHIKDRIPQALDVYTSPNKDLAIVLTSSSLLIYKINRKLLSDFPIGIIKLNNGNSVVMAEWATGDYVEKWERAFIMNNNWRKVEIEK
ncbi:MAG TPA: hypothetical protein PK733_11500 [Clostridiales bacterium]|nr:hypothetical protein [Clostridiales bacterium]